jgi:hypothetical protein
MTIDQSNGDYFIDANGCLAERVHGPSGDVEIVIHYDDIPESDITTIDGIRVTTALRTAIDLATQLDRGDLESLVRECLDRKLFTVREAMERIDQPDMRGRSGAQLLRQLMSGPWDAARTALPRAAH